jgi:endonuclease YncB( thermonuclease family)
MTQEARLQPDDILARLRARRAALQGSSRSDSAFAARVMIAREIRAVDAQIAAYEDALGRLGDLGTLVEHKAASFQPNVRDREQHGLLAGLRHLLGPGDGPNEVAKVAHVIDGDGIRLSDGREVRFIGIDAPEMANVFGEREPWAQEAADANARLVAGRQVRLMREVSETDRHGRLLRHVYVGDTWINGELVRLGLATVLAIPPDVTESARLASL